jgi:4-amino-4-deoxy-L-arabinose transferase-like glycosyltransferase
MRLGNPLRTADPPQAAPEARTRRFVWLVAVLAAGVRLPFAAIPPGRDEAGFLQVAHQWAAGGTSLYGDYWVDRPPLLITVFSVADAAGGLVALRVLGAAAVAVTVLLCATSARMLAGPVAARWAAVAAAALLVSPLLGTLEVNGELLAAPFVAAGVASFLGASRASDERRALALAAAAGATGVCALLVKQNFADALVFGAVLVLVQVRRTARRRTLMIVGGAAAGAGVALGLMTAWTLWRGTSLADLFYALYPFRLHAARVIAAGGQEYADHRGRMLALVALASGVVLLAVALVIDSVRRRAWDPPVVALAAVTVFGCVSITLGGGYWHHYLIQLVVPLSVWAGAVIARGARLSRVAVLLALVVSVVALTYVGLNPARSHASEVGAAIANSAQPGDTLTTLYGDPVVNFASGLPSPYEHLWSLPIRTLDPKLTELSTVLTGSRAPTWVVASRSLTAWGLSTSEVERIVAERYRAVAVIDGTTVYLHRTAERARPVVVRR